jgi:ABC-type sugar transport system substrate-binding protein
MNFTKRILNGAKATSAIVAGAMLVSLTAGSGMAADSKPDIRIGYTPKFLKDDFMTLLLASSKKEYAARGFTLVGAPDPNRDRPRR